VKKTLIALSTIMSILLVTSNFSANAMEANDNKDSKDKKITEKKKIKKKVVKKTIEKKKTKTTQPKIMAEKTLQTMQTKPKLIGGVDLSMASPVQGSQDAKIIIIEFGDYQCPKCFSWFTKEKPIIESQYITTGKASLYFVDIPFIGPDSDSAALASYCADEQGKYWEYHAKTYTNQGGIQSGWANPENLKKFASELGLDIIKFNQCLDSLKYLDRVNYNRQVAVSSGVQGTPTFLIVGADGKAEKISGPQPASVFSAVIDKMYLK
jgi:protein-disulfide isomerase